MHFILAILDIIGMKYEINVLFVLSSQGVHIVVAIIIAVVVGIIIIIIGIKSS